MPDQGLAPWVSANDKPTTTTGSKPVSGDAAERRLKGDVMQLPARDRRRIKDLVQNDVGISKVDLWTSTNMPSSGILLKPYQTYSSRRIASLPLLLMQLPVLVLASAI